MSQGKATKSKFQPDIITRKLEKELRNELQKLIFDVDPDFSNIG